MNIPQNKWKIILRPGTTLLQKLSFWGMVVECFICGPIFPCLGSAHCRNTDTACSGRYFGAHAICFYEYRYWIILKTSSYFAWLCYCSSVKSMGMIYTITVYIDFMSRVILTPVFNIIVKIRYGVYSVVGWSKMVSMEMVVSLDVGTGSFGC